MRDGVRGVTVEGIARATGAPIGSVYHRFRSVDEVIARSWLRAVRRSQGAALAAAEGLGWENPVESAVTVVLALYDFCVADPPDAVLLASFRQADFTRLRLEPELAEDLARLNEGIEPLVDRLARACYGRADARTRDLVHLVVADLPYGLARRHLESGRRPPPSRRAAVAAAARAILTGPMSD